MAKDLTDRVLRLLRESSYQPLKPKALARKLSIDAEGYADLRKALRELIAAGKIEQTSHHTIRLTTRVSELLGVFRGVRGGGGYVRPRPGPGVAVGDVRIRPGRQMDAASGDVVLVRLDRRLRKALPAEGEIIEVVERASDRFVGTYHVVEGDGLVRVDGGIFHEDIYVGDAQAKGAKPLDKVVLEMLRFPSAEWHGEGVIVEVLGPRGAPGVDLISVIRQFHLPDEFSPEALAEARACARTHEEQKVGDDRKDLTQVVTVTVDPVDARDFDDAISLDRDANGHWTLGVHIADVSTFVPEGSELDQEARRRGNSVYLPGKVLPMLPELISNGLASLQEGRVRYTKSVWIDFDPEGRITHVDFGNTAIKVSRRLTYEQVMEFFGGGRTGNWGQPVQQLLERMRELATILRARRRDRGFLELDMPETVLGYDDDGKITGATYAVNDESHQMIEEFMVTANEAVARKLEDQSIPFPRRVHEIPDPRKLKAFGEFVKSLGIPVEDIQSRFELQRILRLVAGKPSRHAVHYALLRSMKIAQYSPAEEGHFALASEYYCHFTSPIRRYPDLVVHRLLDRYLREGKAKADSGVLVVLAEHCSFTERRAANAERELIKIKLLEYLSHRVGEETTMLITGVEEFGFFAQGIDFPADGLVHVRTLVDDHYVLEPGTHSLVGKRRGRRFRLGDRIRCVIWKVDQEQRQLDLRLAEEPKHRPAIGSRKSFSKRPKKKRR